MAVQVVWLEHETTPVADTDPKWTEVAPAVVEKFAPVIVTCVPTGPEVGEMDETVGGGAL